MRKLLVAVSFTLSLFGMAHAQEYPRAPFFAACENMEASSFSRIFSNSSCEQEFISTLSTSTSAEVVRWLRSKRTCVREFAHFSWLAATVIDAKLQSVSWLQQLTLIGERLFPEKVCPDGVCNEQVIESYLTAMRGQPISDETKKHTNDFLAVVEQDQKFKPMMDKAYEAVIPICAYHSSLGCQSAMRWLLDQMYPRSYSTIINGYKESFTFSMVPSYRKVFTDELTQDRIIAAALIALQLSRQNLDRQTNHSVFFDIMASAFVGEEQRLWDVLTVLATRGAAWATATDMVRNDNRGTFAALMVLSAAMPLLDQRGLAQSKAWSYIADATTTCYQPKSYHFWMAASFARQLHNSGYSHHTAELVPVLLGAMYESGSTTYGRQPDDVFFVTTFDPIVNRTRRELTHHRLGAKWSIRPETLEKLSFDRELELFFYRSSALPNVSTEEMRRMISSPLKRWQLWTDLVGFYEVTDFEH